MYISSLAATFTLIFILGGCGVGFSPTTPFSTHSDFGVIVGGGLVKSETQDVSIKLSKVSEVGGVLRSEGYDVWLGTWGEKLTRDNGIVGYDAQMLIPGNYAVTEFLFEDIGVQSRYHCSGGGTMIFEVSAGVAIFIGEVGLKRHLTRPVNTGGGPSFPSAIVPSQARNNFTANRDTPLIDSFGGFNGAQKNGRARFDPWSFESAITFDLSDTSATTAHALYPNIPHVPKRALPRVSVVADCL